MKHFIEKEISENKELHWKSTKSEKSQKSA